MSGRLALFLSEYLGTMTVKNYEILYINCKIDRGSCPTNIFGRTRMCTETFLKNLWVSFKTVVFFFFWFNSRRPFGFFFYQDGRFLVFFFLIQDGREFLKIFKTVVTKMYTKSRRPFFF